MIMAFFSQIIAKWQLALGAVALLILALTLSYCEGRKDGRAIEQAKWAREQSKAERKQAESTTQATVERITETRTITIKQKARDNAIQATDDDKPSAASNALNCERLRQAGADISHIPACGGRSDGGEAATGP
jgi:hypothetical protein